MRAAAESRCPVTMGQKLDIGGIGNIQHRHAAIAPCAKGIRSRDKPVMDGVAKLWVPTGRLAPRRMHALDPPLADDLGLGWVGHVNHSEHMVRETIEMDRRKGVFAAVVPEPMRTKSARRHKPDLAWVRR